MPIGSTPTVDFFRLTHEGGEVMWIFRVCQDVGNVNELACAVDSVASKMMETFERAGYRWVDNVDGTLEYTYTLDRDRQSD